MDDSSIMRQYKVHTTKGLTDILVASFTLSSHRREECVVLKTRQMIIWLLRQIKHVTFPQPD